MPVLDLCRPKRVWKIRQPSDYRWVPTQYLCASFVLPKNVKFPEIGFNVLCKEMTGGKALCFLTEQDAENFLDLIYRNPNTPSGLEVGPGRGGADLVRINVGYDIPTYIQKSPIEYLASFPDTKIAPEVRDRLTGEVEVSADQQEKEAKEKAREDKEKTLTEEIIKAYTEIWPDLPSKIHDREFKEKMVIDNEPIEISFLMTFAVISPGAMPRPVIEEIHFLNLDLAGLIDILRSVFSIERPIIPGIESVIVSSGSLIYTSSDNSYASLHIDKAPIRVGWDASKIKAKTEQYLADVVAKVKSVCEFVEI